MSPEVIEQTKSEHREGDKSASSEEFDGISFRSFMRLCRKFCTDVWEAMKEGCERPDSDLLPEELEGREYRKFKETTPEESPQEVVERVLRGQLTDVQDVLQESGIWTPGADDPGFMSEDLERAQAAALECFDVADISAEAQKLLVDYKRPQLVIFPPGITTQRWVEKLDEHRETGRYCRDGRVENRILQDLTRIDESSVDLSRSHEEWFIAITEGAIRPRSVLENLEVRKGKIAQRIDRFDNQFSEVSDVKGMDIQVYIFLHLLHQLKMRDYPRLDVDEGHPHPGRKTFLNGEASRDENMVIMGEFIGALKEGVSIGGIYKTAFDPYYGEVRDFEDCRHTYLRPVVIGNLVA